MRLTQILEEEERLRETSPAPGELVVHPGVMKVTHVVFSLLSKRVKKTMFYAFKLMLDEVLSLPRNHETNPENRDALTCQVFKQTHSH